MSDEKPQQATPELTKPAKKRVEYELKKPLIQGGEELKPGKDKALLNERQAKSLREQGVI